MRSTRCAIELFGDEVESIRTFDVATQRSLETLATADVTVLDRRRQVPDALHQLSARGQLVHARRADRPRGGRAALHRRLEHPEDFFATSTTLREAYKFPSVTASGVPAGSYETTAHLEFESVEQFSGDIAKVRGELESAAAGQQVYLVCETDAEVERLSEVFRETQAGAARGGCTLRAGGWRTGFAC